MEVVIALCPIGGPPLTLLFQVFDFIEAVQTAPIDARAVLGRLVPGAGAGQVAGPEGPGAALIGAHRINATAFTAILCIKKDTIFVFGLFNNRGTQSDAP